MVNGAPRRQRDLAEAQQQPHRPRYQRNLNTQRSDPDLNHHRYQYSDSHSNQNAPCLEPNTQNIRGPALDVTGLIGNLVSNVMNEPGIRNMLSTLDDKQERHTSPFKEPYKRSRSVDLVIDPLILRRNRARGHPDDMVDPMILERSRTLPQAHAQYFRKLDHRRNDGHSSIYEQRWNSPSVTNRHYNKRSNFDYIGQYFQSDDKRSRSVDLITDPLILRRNQARGYPDDMVDPRTLPRSHSQYFRNLDHRRNDGLSSNYEQRWNDPSVTNGHSNQRSNFDYIGQSFQSDDKRSESVNLPQQHSEAHSLPQQRGSVQGSMKRSEAQASSSRHSVEPADLDPDDPNNSFLFAEDEIPFDDLPPEPGRHILTTSEIDHLVIKVDMSQPQKERSFKSYDNDYERSYNVNYNNDNIYSKSPEKYTDVSARVIGFMNSWIDMQSQRNDRQPQKRPMNHDIDNVYSNVQLPCECEQSHEPPGVFDDHCPRDNNPACPQNRRATGFDTLQAVENCDNLNIKDFDLNRWATDYANSRATDHKPYKLDEKAVCSNYYEKNDKNDDKSNTEVSSKKRPSKVRQLNESYLANIYENSYSPRDFQDNDDRYPASSNTPASNVPAAACNAMPELVPITSASVPTVTTNKTYLPPPPISTVSQHYAHVARSRKLLPSLHSVIEDVSIIQKESVTKQQLKKSNAIDISHIIHPASHLKPCPVYHANKVPRRPHNVKDSDSSSYPLRCPTCVYAVLCDAETEEQL